MYAKDLLEDPFMRVLDKTFLLWHLALGLALLLAGGLVWGWYTGVSFLVYGMFLRLFYVMHVTWLVNSGFRLARCSSSTLRWASFSAPSLPNGSPNRSGSRSENTTLPPSCLTSNTV